MTKPGIRTDTLQVLDYIEAYDYINTVLGYSQRDAHKHFKPELPHVDPDDNKYGQQNGGTNLDYWHYVLEVFLDSSWSRWSSSWSSDSYVPGTYSFVELAQYTEKKFGPENWRTIIAKVWANEYPDEYTLWMSW
jgi:hypothetical protein